MRNYSLLFVAVLLLATQVSRAEKISSGEYTFVTADLPAATLGLDDTGGARQSWRMGGPRGSKEVLMADYEVTRKDGRTLLSESGPRHFTFQAAGRYFAVGEYNQVRIFRDHGGRADQVAKVGKYHSILAGLNNDNWADLAGWSPSGRFLAITLRKGDDRSVVIFDSATEMVTEIPANAVFAKIVWSSSEKILAGIGSTSAATLIDTAAKKVVRSVSAPAGSHTASYREIKGVSEAGELLR